MVEKTFCPPEMDGDFDETVRNDAAWSDSFVDSGKPCSYSEVSDTDERTIEDNS